MVILHIWLNLLALHMKGRDPSRAGLFQVARWVLLARSILPTACAILWVCQTSRRLQYIEIGSVRQLTLFEPETGRVQHLLSCGHWSILRTGFAPCLTIILCIPSRLLSEWPPPRSRQDVRDLVHPSNLERSVLNKRLVHHKPFLSMIAELSRRAISPTPQSAEDFAKGHRSESS